MSIYVAIEDKAEKLNMSTISTCESQHSRVISLFQSFTITKIKIIESNAFLADDPVMNAQPTNSYQ